MTERELFEEWAYSNKWNIFRVRDMGIDRYVDDFVDGAWHGWQESSNRKGYKLVPVEANDCMKCSVRDFDPDIEDYANMGKFEWEELCGDIYKAMIGAVE